MLKKKRLKDNTCAIMKDLVPASKDSVVSTAPSKNKGKKGGNSKIKSPSQLTAEDSLKSQ